MVEAQVEDSVSLVRRSADRGCHYFISNFINRNIFSYPIYVHLNLNIESMDVFDCLQIIDIYVRVGVTHYNIACLSFLLLLRGNW